MTAALGCTAGIGDLHLVAIGVVLALVLLLIDHSVERLAGRRARHGAPGAGDAGRE